jgi:hypothetical protein
MLHLQWEAAACRRGLAAEQFSKGERAKAEADFAQARKLGYKGE